MLQLTLGIDALPEHFEQSTNKQVKYVSQKVTLHCPNSLRQWMACSNILEIPPPPFACALS